MARTWTPRRVRSEDERGGSSGYIQLDEGEKFVGYALFEGDPAKDEVGYYEYLEHWVTGPKSRSVPCAGDDCPFCEDGDKPRDRAKTLWWVTIDAKGNKLGADGEGELRIFNFNSILIKQITEMRSEDELIMGQQFRVTRMDDRGNYVLQPKTGKKLTKQQVKEHLKSKDAPDFNALVTSQLRKAMEGIAVARAMDDDDDDDEDEKPARGKKGKASAKSNGSKADEPDEWPDALEEEFVTVAKIEKGGDWIEVVSEEYEGKMKVWTTDDIEFDLTELSKGDDVTLTTAEQDDDGDYVLTEEPEVAEDAKAEKEDDEVENIEEMELELLRVSKAKNNFVVNWQDEDITIEGGELDVSEWKKGDTGIVSAEWDADDEIWTLTALEEPEEEAAAKDDDDDDDDNDLPDAIEDAEFEILDMDTRETTLEVRSEELDLEFTLYFLDKGPASEVDFDDYEKGAKILITAEKDSTGDMVATAIPEIVEEKKSKKAASAKKSTKGKKTASKGKRS